MDAVMHVLDGLDPTLIYLAVGLLALGEAAAFVGLFVPGEISVIVGGALAAQGRVSLPVMIAVAAVGAVAGDVAGYEIGRRYGAQVLGSRRLRRYDAGMRKAAEVLVRYGGPAVFVGRWTTGLRACVPALAGAVRMPYGTFLRYNLLGGVAWATAFTLLGYGAGSSLPTIERVLGPVSWVLLGAVALGAVLCWRTRRSQGEPEEAAWPERVAR